MWSSNLIVIVLLCPAALAHRQLSGHRYGPYKGAHRPTGVHFPIGVGTAPYGLSNGTVVAGSSGHASTLRTADQTIPLSVAGTETNNAAGQATHESDAASGTVYQPVNNAVNEKLAVPTSQVASELFCGGTVTVTYNPTFTVTVNPSSISSIDSAVTLSMSVPSSKASQPSASAEAELSSGAQSISTSILPSQSVPAQVESSPAAQSSATFTSSISTTPTQIETSPVVSSSAAVTSAKVSAVTPSSSTPAASAPSTKIGFRTKRGIIASLADQANLLKAFSNPQKVSWLGDWYSGPPNNLPPTVTFVPQMYGKDSNADGSWTSNANKALAAGNDYFLSFGEPNTPNAKLYMDAPTAVQVWNKEMEPYAAKGATIGAPGVLQNPQDLAWLEEFLGLCSHCSIGFLAVHWFYTAVPENVQSFKDLIRNVTAIAKGKPVWVDNFQASGTNAAQKAFLTEILPWLDSQEAVARYAYVSPTSQSGTGFLNSDGSASDLATWYASF